MAGRTGGVFDEHKQLLQEQVCHAPAVKKGEVPASRWTLARLRAACPFLSRYSLPGVSLFVRAAGIGWRRGRPQYYSPDPAYCQKEADLLQALRLVAANPETTVALFIDEVTFTGWPEPSLDWCQKAPAPRPVADRKQSRYRRSRLVAALDAWTGQVCFLQADSIGGSVFARFLRQLESHYRHAQRIFPIWDNWTVHACKEVQQQLAQLPRLHVISLPTYAPWLNPIEKLWRKFRQEVDYLHQLADDWQGLRERVKQFFAQFAPGSRSLLRYVGLIGTGKLACALRGP